jgi:uncharacterized protein (DUF362 family)
MSRARAVPGGMRGYTRREFIRAAACGAIAAGTGLWSCSPGRRAEVFIAKAANYGTDLVPILTAGLRELGVSAAEIAGKRILLKPNLVEPRAGAEHINTHPAVVRAAAECFLKLGAAAVEVGEGSGHCRDPLRVLEESGLAEVLHEDRIRFTDLNLDDWGEVPNAGSATKLAQFALPDAVRRADWVVSVAKMKTHHWAGITLSMKNLFGVLPGALYGWPKSVLHQAGIHQSVVDICATVRPRFAIVDGIVGMDGDGPIMGDAKAAGVLVLGRDLPAVDATAARIMVIDPEKVPYLAFAGGRLGVIDARSIDQRGERIADVATPFALVPKIPAHRGLRQG